jgi:tetratricopeptide (TPR) repeat protein
MLLALFLFAISTAPAAAQMSVTTFGATDARACYEDAFEGFARSTASCDAALRKGGLTQRDETATYVNRGVIYNRMGDPDAALADFDIALARDPGLGEAMINRGNSLYLKGDYDGAVSEYERALAAGTSKAHVAWFNIGLAEEARKRPEAAAAAYRKALEINPDFAMARDKL